MIDFQAMSRFHETRAFQGFPLDRKTAHNVSDALRRGLPGRKVFNIDRRIRQFQNAQDARVITLLSNKALIYDQFGIEGAEVHHRLKAMAQRRKLHSPKIF